jgi:hypothetical protein
MKQAMNWALLLVCVSIGALGAVEDRPLSTKPPAAKAAQSFAPGEAAVIHNGISMWFRSNGESGRNPLNGGSGISNAPFRGVSTVFQDGFVWGGRVADGQAQEIRVGGSTYAVGTQAGGILSKGVAAAAGAPGTRIYRVRRVVARGVGLNVDDRLRNDATLMLGKNVTEVTPEDIEEQRAQYIRDWREWPWQQGAPFYDRDGDGVYTPRFDDDGVPVVDANTDEPGLNGASQVAWFAINDLDPGATAALYGSPPIGLEVQVTLWVYFDDADWDLPELQDIYAERSPYSTIFKRYKVIYKGTAQTPDDARIQDLYFAQWSDPDLGDFGDDLVGSDPDLSLGYVYNVAEDAHYRGLVTPAVGYAFLNRKATAFGYLAPGLPFGDPTLGQYDGTLQWYNWLRGFLPTVDINAPTAQQRPDGTATLFPFDGTPTFSPAFFPMERGAGVLALCGEDPTCLRPLTPQVRIAQPGVVPQTDYELTFSEGGNGLEWSLSRVADGTAVVAGASVEAGIAGVEDGAVELSFPGVTGMQAWDIPEGERWWTWTGADFGAEGFLGAITGDVNSNWFAPTTVTPDRMRRVELRFTSVVEEDGENQHKPLDPNNQNVSWGYRYLRGAGIAAPSPDELTSTSNPYDWSAYIVNSEGPGTYIYQDRVPIAVSAWDIDSDPPRRLEVAFLENNAPGGLVNGAYGPAWYNTVDNVSGGSPREWLFVMDLDYTDPTQGENSQVLLDHGLIADSGEAELPIMWISFASRRREDRFPQDGDTFLMVPFPSSIYQPGDSFTFTVPASRPPEGWVDGIGQPAGDRRLMLSSGPVAMALGDTQVVDIALLVGNGALAGRDLPQHLNSVVDLKRLAAQARVFARRIERGGATAVMEVEGMPLPEQSSLLQNYPNPFNPSTVIHYQIASAGPVLLSVYNAMGQRVRLLSDEHHGVGTYRALWDGRDDAGRGVASGVYFYRLQASRVVQTRSMTLLK